MKSVWRKNWCFFGTHYTIPRILRIPRFHWWILSLPFYCLLYYNCWVMKFSVFAKCDTFFIIFQVLLWMSREEFLSNYLLCNVEVKLQLLCTYIYYYFLYVIRPNSWTWIKKEKEVLFLFIYFFCQGNGFNRSRLVGQSETVDRSLIFFIGRLGWAYLGGRLPRGHHLSSDLVGPLLTGHELPRQTLFLGTERRTRRNSVQPRRKPGESSRGTGQTNS